MYRILVVIVLPQTDNFEGHVNIPVSSVILHSDYFNECRFNLAPRESTQKVLGEYNLGWNWSVEFIGLWLIQG
jgi:hypothetical protein